MSDSQVLYVGAIENVKQQVLVASSTYSGDDADYYCTGINDDILIKAAIDYLYNVDGGELLLTEGVFNVTNYININHSNIIISGRGYSTIISKNCDATGIYINGTVDAEIENIIVRNLKITRNSEDENNQSLLITSYVYNVLIDSCNIDGCYGDYAINIYDTANEVRFDKCLITDNKYNGLRIVDSIYPVRITNCEISYNGGRGLVLSNTAANIISNNYIHHNGITSDGLGLGVGQGIYGGGYRAKYADNMIYENVGCGFENNGTQNLISANMSFDNGNLINYWHCNSSTNAPQIMDDTGVSVSNATWEFTSTLPYSGDGQHRFSKTVAAGTKAYVHLVDNVGAADRHGLLVNTVYEFNAWFKCYSSASGGYQGLRIYQVTTAAGAASATVVTIATTEWQQIGITATIYANATTAYIDLWASSSLGSTTYCDLDNLRLYVPGITNGHNHNFYENGTNTLDGL